jgi:hypothetical protein
LSDGRDALLAELRKVRKALIRSYLLHVSWFTAMCVYSVSEFQEKGLQASALLTLVTVPQVLFHAAKTHKICRAVDPRSRTFGWIPIILMTIALTPFESGLILPFHNLMAANRILKKHGV